VLQYRLLKFSPKLLRFYRNRMLLDVSLIASYLPAEGKVLEIGCGVGALTYAMASRHPAVDLLGIDIDAQSIRFAQAYHTLPNTRFRCQPVESVEECFDCIMLVDVLHHVPPTQYDHFFSAASRLLAPGGCLFIKDVERRLGFVSFAMDRYISGCRAEEINLHNCDEMGSLVSKHLDVRSAIVRYRFPFPHYYIVARPV
jgi:2-polyprenyl-3-methyl-5-hydroxy-6-metoxy-1,4-benzoquinol methylase